MSIARLTLITLVTFAFLMGCGMYGQKAEVSEISTTTKVTIEEPMDEVAVPETKKSAYQEVTLQVEGMT